MTVIRKWLGIPLTYVGDASPAEVLLEELRKVFRNSEGVEFFVPKFTERDKRHTKEIVLFPGYVFVGIIEGQKVPSMNGHPYFENPISFNKKLSYVRLHEIEKMQLQLKSMKRHDVSIGSKVRIISGIYKDLEGDVVDFNDASVTVQICLASKELLVIITPNFLDNLDQI